MMKIQHIDFQMYKGLRALRIQTNRINVLTGRNNAGKSTFLSAFRLLDAALSYARRRSAVPVPTHQGQRYGYAVPTDNLSISMENIHTDLEDVETVVDFDLGDDIFLTLYFPVDGGCFFFVQGMLPPRTPSKFRQAFPIQVIQVPVLGPLEHEEPLVTEGTLRRGVATHRASRHFRNYWHRYPEGFPKFQKMIAQTWEGMSVEPPELFHGASGGVLHMFCEEFRRTRELYWCGFGFQIWCQLLTHISRATPSDIIIVDEPETYLHPVVQKQLLGILRETGAQVFMATHSATIIASARAGEVLEVDRHHTEERRYKETGVSLCRRLKLLP
jgi:energy-coupling factor transporter ATP-binding protein EcfA2